jgi:large subunit ribosomal protein L24
MERKAIKRSVKSGDRVMVISGKFKGKSGKIIMVDRVKDRILVEGINFVKKHARQTRQDRRGGITDIEAPIAISNVMLICTHCGVPVRVGWRETSDGHKTRYCKRCNENIEKV